MLVIHLRWLHAKGLQPDRVVDQVQSIDEQVVINENTLVAFMLGEAERGVDLLDDVDAVKVSEAHLQYLDAIGAVGPEAGLDDVL